MAHKGFNCSSQVLAHLPLPSLPQLQQPIEILSPPFLQLPLPAPASGGGMVQLGAGCSAGGACSPGCLSGVGAHDQGAKGVLGHAVQGAPRHTVQWGTAVVGVRSGLPKHAVQLAWVHLGAQLSRKAHGCWQASWAHNAAKRHGVQQQGHLGAWCRGWVGNRNVGNGGRSPWCAWCSSGMCGAAPWTHSPHWCSPWDMPPQPLRSWTALVELVFLQHLCWLTESFYSPMLLYKTLQMRFS